MRTVFYLILVLGLIGVIRGAIELFLAGRHLQDDDRIQIYQTEWYRNGIRRTADYFILIGGASLFLWLI